MNRYTGETLSDENEHIKQSITDILTTQIGTRLQRRDYGSNIPKLIDQPINRILMLQLASCAVTALRKWEKRIKIRQFKPIFANGKITANILATRGNQIKTIDFNDIFIGHKYE
ncbi:GPW/gp25 family protein [Pasteurella bettyae]|uniref:GPW/gp25 family protein n=1 Tax=Pasteurella bettyae TaxID=752 RepID=UPI003D287452